MSLPIDNISFTFAKWNELCFYFAIILTVLDIYAIFYGYRIVLDLKINSIPCIAELGMTGCLWTVGFFIWVIIGMIIFFQLPLEECSNQITTFGIYFFIVYLAYISKAVFTCLQMFLYQYE